MAAKRFVQSTVNWGAIAERVHPEQKAQYLVFKSKSDGFLRKVAALPENPPKIDWAYYKGKVPMPRMVEEFQKKYEAFKIPVPVSTFEAEISAQEKAAAEEVQKFKVESAARIVEFETELNAMQDRPSIDEMTEEDFAYYYPAEAIDVNNPTMWPHDPEDQPGPEGDNESKLEAH